MRSRTLKPRAWSSAPRAADASPLPSEETTPPVMKTKRAISDSYHKIRDNPRKLPSVGRKQVLKIGGLRPRSVYFEAEEVAALEGVAAEEAAGALVLAEDEDAQMLSLAFSTCLAETELDTEELAGSLSGAGRTAGLLFRAGAAGAVEEAAGAAPARGKSLRDGAAEALVWAAGAVGWLEVLTVRPLVSTLSTAEVWRVEKLPTMVRPMELAKNIKARIAVALVRRLPAPRADMKPPPPPPMPSAPPSERWMRIRPAMLTLTMIWTVKRMANSMSGLYILDHGYAPATAGPAREVARP